MSPPGGSATLYGVLYQILGSLHWAARLSFDAVVADDDFPSAVLVIEPAGGGGDLRIGDRAEQWKARSGRRTWSFAEIVADVLPDLYLAVPDAELDREAVYAFVTEGRIGDWQSALQFFAHLPKSVPQDPVAALRLDNSFIPLRARKPERASTLFAEIVNELRRVRPRIAAEPLELTQRKVWHLLSRFSIASERGADELKREIDRFLAVVVPHPEHIEGKRYELCGRILELAGKGPVSITPDDLLGNAGLSIDPLKRLSALDTHLRECLRLEFARLQYRPEEDIRSPPPWPLPKRILLIAGESGQGKTWRLCSIGNDLVNHGSLVSLQSATGDPQQTWSGLLEFVWYRVARQTVPPPPWFQVRRQIAQLRQEDPQLVLLVDGVLNESEARTLIGKALVEEKCCLAMTVPTPLAEGLRASHPNDVEVVFLQDFSDDELREYLDARGRDWVSLPNAVRDTLRRPLLANLYCTITTNTEWSPVHEYELYEQWWARIVRTPEQYEHPSDAPSLARVAARLLDPESVYPWNAGVLLHAGVSDDSRRRLERVGWLRTGPDGRVRVWHDRLLNWAVAEGLVDAWKGGELTADQVCAKLQRCSHSLVAGQQLGYVPMDVVWLAADPQCGLQRHVSQLIAAIEGEHPELFYSQMLPTLGVRVIPALISRLRETAGGVTDRHPRLVAAALKGVGNIAPEVVILEATKLLVDPSISFQ